MRRVALSALRAGNADGAYVEEVLRTEEVVEVVAAEGVGVPELGSRLPYPGSLTEEVIEDGEPVILEDLSASPDPIAGVLENRCGDCSALVIPLLSEGHALGALILLRRRGREPFSTEQVEIARTLADLAALALLRVIEGQRYRALYDHNPSIYFTIDADGAIRSANQFGARMLGYEPDELIGRSVLDIVSPEDRERVEEQIGVCLADPGRIHRMEFQKVRRDGSLIWVRETMRAVRRTDARLVILAVCEDITDRVRAEEALRIDRALLEAQSEALEDGLLVVSPQGEMLSYNTGFVKMWGFPETIIDSGLDGEALQWAARQVEDPEAFLADVERVYSRPEGPRRDEIRLRDGRVFDRYGSPVGDDGVQYGYLWFFRDVTEQRRVVETQSFLADAGRILAASLEYEKTLKTVADLAVPALADWCVVDLCEEGEIRRVAVAHADPSKDQLAADYERLYPPDAQSTAGVARVIRTGGSELIPVIDEEILRGIARDDRQYRMLEELGLCSAMIVPLSARGAILGAITLVSSRPSRRYRDDDLELARLLAERAALSVDKARLYRSAQEATQARDEVLSVVSHDLRNPLSTIITSVSFLPELQPDTPAAVLRQYAIIQRQAEQANRLIQDLLDVSRLEAGRLPIDPMPLNLGTLVTDAVEMNRPLVEAKGISLACERPDQLPTLVADRERLLQAMGNLLGNAAKFTPEGGRITVGCTATDEEVRLYVSDTGRGIAAEDLPHLFDRFYQARSTRRGGGGTALDRPRIAEAHRGRITVESAPGEGSTFVITLPRHE